MQLQTLGQEKSVVGHFNMWCPVKVWCYCETKILVLWNYSYEAAVKCVEKKSMSTSVSFSKTWSSLLHISPYIYCAVICKNLEILQSMLLVMSIKIKNNNGPMTKPCGTLDVTGTGADGMFSTATKCYWWDGTIFVLVFIFVETVHGNITSIAWPRNLTAC